MRFRSYIEEKKDRFFALEGFFEVGIKFFSSLICNFIATKKAKVFEVSELILHKVLI